MPETANAFTERVSLPIRVTTIVNPSFGSFHSGGTGGEISVDTEGNRRATGDILLLNSGNSVSPAVFEIRCQAFTMVHLLGEAYFTLHGSNGVALRARIVSTNPAFPLIAPENAAEGFLVNAGLTLEIPAGQTLEAGSYNGSLHATWFTE